MFVFLCVDFSKARWKYSPCYIFFANWNNISVLPNLFWLQRLFKFYMWSKGLSTWIHYCKFNLMVNHLLAGLLMEQHLITNGILPKKLPAFIWLFLIFKWLELCLFSLPLIISIIPRRPVCVAQHHAFCAAAVPPPITPPSHGWFSPSFCCWGPWCLSSWSFQEWRHSSVK